MKKRANSQKNKAKKSRRESVRSFFKIALRIICKLTYAVLAMVLTVFAGCATLMPTREPPLTKSLGYDVPDYKGWTLVFLNQSAYKLEVQKLRTWKVMQDMVNLPAVETHGQVVSWLGALGVGGVLGGIPLALNRLPNGAVRKEEHENAVAEALKKDPKSKA